MHPDHKTISNFLKENKDAVRNLFKPIMIFLRETGLIDGKFLACDGPKYRANAVKRHSVSREMTDEELNKSIKELEFYLSEIANDPEDENKKPRVDLSKLKKKGAGDKVKKLWRKIKFIQDANQEIQINPRKSVTLTDVKSRLMITNDGVLPSFNQQIVVDSKEHFIVAEKVIIHENDYDQLNYMVDIANVNSR